MQIADRLKFVAPSATLAITAKAKQLKKDGVKVINFAAGEPDFDTPQKIKQSAIEAIEKGFTKYTPSTGTPELKSAISDKFRLENKIECSPEKVVVSCGAKHSLYNCLQAILNPGDEVIIFSPFWLSYPAMVYLASGVPVIFQTDKKDGFSIDIKKLESLITAKTKAIIINSPSNPTGKVLSKQELTQLAELAEEKDLLIISDEIYEKLIYDGLEHFSIGSLGGNIAKRTVTVNGVSKSFSMTGWRIGYLCAPVEIAKAVSMIQDHSTSNPASISQKAALAALKLDNQEVTAFRQEFEKRRDLLIKKLQSVKGVSFIKPQGAFYLFLDISGLSIKPFDFAQKILDQNHVALIPAESFGSDSHVRLSFATSTDDIEKGVELINSWIVNR